MGRITKQKNDIQTQTMQTKRFYLFRPSKTVIAEVEAQKRDMVKEKQTFKPGDISIVLLKRSLSSVVYIVAGFGLTTPGGKSKYISRFWQKELVKL